MDGSLLQQEVSGNRFVPHVPFVKGEPMPCPWSRGVKAREKTLTRGLDLPVPDTTLRSLTQTITPMKYPACGEGLQQTPHDITFLPMMLPYTKMAACCSRHQLICRELAQPKPSLTNNRQQTRVLWGLLLPPSPVQSGNKPWNITEHGSYHPAPYLGRRCIWEKGAGLSREVPTQSFLLPCQISRPQHLSRERKTRLGGAMVFPIPQLMSRYSRC